MDEMSQKIFQVQLGMQRLIYFWRGPCAGWEIMSLMVKITKNADKTRPANYCRKAK